MASFSNAKEPPDDNLHHWTRPPTKKQKIESDPEKFASRDSAYPVGPGYIPPVPRSDADFDDSSAYVAIDPFVPSVAKSVAGYSSHLPTKQSQVRPTIDPSHSVPEGAHGVTTVPTSSYIIAFFLDTLPRQIYLYFLLTLPSLYFSRVARIFEEAQLSMPDIKKMAISSANDFQDRFPCATKMLGEWKTPAYSVHSPFDTQVVARFKASWEQFVDSLMKEWKTLNLVSVLLLSFNTMRKTHRAAEWAEVSEPRFTGLMAYARFISSGRTENKNVYLVERLGITCDACHMVIVVYHILLNLHNDLSLAYRDNQ
ncbi:hypothetical protein C0993_012488 [Termitomyces sp. T159_Od127]|nr:hypothetical protein C0993_012488 [Termitomyces sp. T159_Od127]